MNQVIVAGVASGAVYAIFAVGLVLVFKTTRVLNFAQAEIGTFATFVTWLVVVRAHLPWSVGAAAGIATAILLGFVLERGVLGKLIDADRSTVVIATAAIALLLGAVESKLWGGTPSFLPSPTTARGIELGGVVLAPTRIAALVIAAAVSGGLWVFLNRTTTGTALLAASQNPVAVQLAGIRLRRLSLITWTTSSALGAAASLLIAPTLGAFAPYYLARVMLFGFAAGVLGGGMASLPGAVAGGLALGVWEAFVSRQFPSVAGVVDASVFLILAAALLDRARRSVTTREAASA